MAEFHSIFPTLVSIEENFLTQQECDLIISFCDSNMGRHGAFTGDAYSTHDGVSSVIKDINKKFNIEEKIQAKINLYTTIAGYHEVFISSSWVNKQHKGSILNEHVHPVSKISGALYLKSDDYSSKLFFHNPNPFIDFVEPSIPTQYNEKLFVVNPRAGTLVLFPSWLKHGSNHTENGSTERIVLSFNTVEKSLFKGK